MPHELSALLMTLFWGWCSYMEFGYRYSCSYHALQEHAERYGKIWSANSIDLAVWGPIGLIFTFLSGEYKNGRLYPWRES